jgi:hypothetical protein
LDESTSSRIFDIAASYIRPNAQRNATSAIARVDQRPAPQSTEFI